MENFLSKRRDCDREFLREGWGDYLSSIEGRMNAAFAFLMKCNDEDADKIGKRLKEFGFRYIVCDGMTRQDYIEFFAANLNKLELSEFSGDEETRPISPSNKLCN